MQNLIIGYGNTDRQDDGVAWHVIAHVIKSLGYEPPEEFEESSPITFGDSDFLFQLQLTPELSELLVSYDRVCFVDAHTGAVPEDVHFEILQPGYQQSPFTHHLTPGSLLAMSSSVYSKAPESVLISVRGYEFGFSRDLSEKSASLVPAAVELIIRWLHSFKTVSGEDS